MGGGAPMANWECLGTLSAPAYNDGPDVDGTLTLNDLLAMTAIDGATANVCANTDVDCATPADTGTTDAMGMVTLSIPPGAPHYIEFNADGYPTHLIFRDGSPPPNWSATTLPLDSAGLDQLVAILGETPDPARGHLGMQVIDCEGNAAPGVIFEVDTADGQSAVGYFTTQGLPNPTLTETTSDGRVGIANVPAGPFTATAKIAATDEVISTRSGFIRAGAIVYPWRHNAEPEPAP